ncbi:hypothetical protein V1498_15000 [Peribacillus sp. SCS-26]|uniref:hypothetical protein n=1 Tax=Paraperibacillus marinus TaxID=3115295 RepID=UPI0039061F7B
MDDFKTERIIVMACSLDLAKSLILYREELVKRSPILMPDSWPSHLFKGFLPFFIEEVEKGADGLKFWIIADLKQKKMVGDLVFHHHTDDTGYMAVSYISPEAEAEYMEESLYIFLKYTANSLGRPVRHVEIECRKQDLSKQKILKELDFRRLREDALFANWFFKYE